MSRYFQIGLTSHVDFFIVNGSTLFMTLERNVLGLLQLNIQKRQPINGAYFVNEEDHFLDKFLSFSLTIIDIFTFIPPDTLLILYPNR